VVASGSAPPPPFADKPQYRVVLRACGIRSSLSDKLNNRVLATGQFREVWADGLWVIAVEPITFHPQLAAVRFYLVDERLCSVQWFLLSKDLQFC
jgi:hypothetical protein